MSNRRRRLRGIEESFRILLVAAAFVATLFAARGARALGCIDGGPKLTITSMTAAGSTPMNLLAPNQVQTFTASGGSGIYTWGAAGGSVSPSMGPSTTFTAGLTAMEQVTVTDSGSCTADLNVYVASILAITPPSATVGRNDSLTFMASGGSAPYGWILLTSGSGMASISASGAYTAGANVGKDQIQLSDSAGETVTATINVVATAPIGGDCTTSDICPADSGGSRHCVDGVCCTAACSGTCQACNTANSVGTCVTISGPPVGTRTCPMGDAQNVCSAKICDGKTPSACSSFVGSTVMCSPSSCVDLIGTPAAVCDWDGGCPTVIPATCSPFACVAGACASSCTNTSDCSPGNYCDVTMGKCVTPSGTASDDGGPTVTAPTPAPKSSGCAAGAVDPSGTQFMLMGLVGFLGLRRRRVSQSR